MFFSSLYKRSMMQPKIFLLLAALVLGAFKPGPEGNEYQVKAMFVFNFTKYIEWPDEVKNNEVFTIGVLGESDILEPLEKIAAQKIINDKKIDVRSIGLDDENYYNIIIVARSRTGKLDAIEKKYAGKGVLIISDESARSAAINLVTRDNKIRFEVNQIQAKNGGVKISSQLLALAISVH